MRFHSIKLVGMLAIGLQVSFSPILRAVGQSVVSSVQGTVADTSGAVVQGATVTLSNTQTGIKLNAQSDVSGSYSFPAVGPGIYALDVSKASFASYRISQFTVVVGEHATEDVKLGVASASSTVVVEANGLENQLDTESNDLGTVIGPQSVAQLPLNGRNYLQLGLLSGATQTTSGASDNTISQTGHPSLSINVAGSQPDFTMYLVNGIQTYGTRAGNTSLNLSVSAIDQFEVHYGFFMPDLGPNPGIVDIITKSGTNKFHGDAYEFVRTNQMEARNYFSITSAGVPIPPGPYHQNQFGFDLGGPVLKDKLFFFANYEGYRQDQSAVVSAYTPTEAMFGGNFSSLSTPIYDPATFNPATGKRTAFPNNIIPASRISTTISSLLNYYLPGSSLTSTPNNVVGTPATTLNSNQFTGRLDYSLNARNQLFAQGSWLNSPANDPGLFPGQGTAYPLDTELVALGWTSTLSSTKVNELRLGMVRDSVYDEGLPVPGLESKLGITGTDDVNGVPAINITGFTGFGTSTGLLGDVDNVYQVHDSFNWLIGNHQLKFGADVAYTRSIQSSANANARGVFTFNDTYTAQLAGSAGSYATVPGTGNAFADFLLGDFTNGQSIGMPRTHYRWTTAEPYIQDTWKAKPNLTVNMALAWYGATTPNPSGSDKNLIHSFDFATGLPTFAALGQTDPEAYTMTKVDFAPRVGVNWQPSFLKDTDVRLGWGLYYTTQSDITAQYSVVSQIITVNNSASNAQPNPTYVLGVNALPAVTVGQITEAQVPKITGAIQYQSPHNPSPYVSQWNLDIQHTFGKKYLLDAAYIGNESHHLSFNFDPIDCSQPGSLECRYLNNPYYPKYSYIQEAVNAAAGNYNSLLIKFQRQYSNGLSLIVNYNYSKAFSDGTEGDNTTLNQDRSCLQCDWGLTASNIPQSLVVSAVADVPVGKDRRYGAHLNPVVNGVIGGWSVDAIVTMQKGNPFTITAPNNTPWSPAQVRANRYCVGQDRPSNRNLRTNGLYWLKAQTPTQTENQGACFVNPAIDPVNLTGPGGSFPSGVVAFFGNSRFDPLTGPGINNWDTGVHKSFPIYGPVNFVLRGEFFNTWNHAQFANPNGLVSSSTFGQVSATQNPAREIQIAGTLSF